MRLRSKLLLAQLPLLVALGAVTLVARWSLDALGQRADRILRENYRSVLAAQRMKESAERIDSGVLFAAAGRPEAGAAQIRENVEAFESELLAQEENLTESGEREATGALRQAWEVYRGHVAEYAADDAKPGRIDAYFRDLGPSFVRVKDAANRILDLNQDAMHRKSDEAAATARALGDTFMLAAILACVLGAALSALLTARLLRPIGVLQQTARRIGSGDLAVRARVDGGDEIRALADEFNAMADRLQRYRESTLGELLEAQHALHAAIDSLPDPVVVVGATGDIRDANEAAERVLTPALVASRSPTVDLLPEPVRSAVIAARDRVLRGGAAGAADLREAIRLDRPEGPVILLPRASPVRSADGDVVAVTVLLQDVTRLLRLDELKDDLVATVAHEFRTPLTSLRMAIHLCLEEVAGPTTEKQRDLLGASRGDCERLQRLVDDMLDLAKMRAGGSAVTLAAVPAGEVVRDAVAASGSAARDRRVEIVEEVSPDAADVLADRERIAVALGNLVANAVRVSPEGRTVTVSALAHAQGVRFEVTDQGPGVPAAVRENLFERGTRGAGGGAAGLGLWIAREIVRAHHGDIGVEPGPAGEGSRFWICVPCAPAVAAADGPGDPDAPGPATPHTP